MEFIKEKINSMKILLTGSNGQLGYNLKKMFGSLKIEYIATDYQELDIITLKYFFDGNKDLTI